jgi:uncharacterized membrane protein YhaH (DUF805 family)
MIDWYKKVVFDNYANFNGRARRSEFWYFTLVKFILTIVSIIPFIILTVIFRDEKFASVFMIVYFCFIILFEIIMLLPTLAVSTRRLHDTGHSGWLQLISFIPGGGIVLLVFYFMDSVPFDNKWGSNPKKIADTITEIGQPEIEKY